MMKETLTVAFFVIGNLVGAGFFMMPAAVAPLGINLIWSWMIGALIAFTFALIFGRLYMLYPNSNDLVDYFDDFSLKQTVAFLYWIGIVIGNVIVLTMVVSVLKVTTFSSSLALVAILIFIISCANYFFSSSDIAIIESSLSLIKFSLLVVMPLVIFMTNTHSLQIPKANGTFNDVFQMGVLSFWSFMGIETAGVFGRGKAARNGLFIGIIACFLLYVLSCLLIISCVPLNLLLSGEEIPLVCLLKVSKFQWLANYAIYLIAFTSLASLYGWFATSSRLALSFAKNGVFPKLFLSSTKSSGSVWGLWGTSILTFIAFACVACFNIGQQFEIIADFCVNISLIVFALCGNALYTKSQNFLEECLSLFGMILVVMLLTFNAIFALFSISFFVIVYFISRFFNNRTK